MLIENKTNGLTLDKSSNILLGNVDKLNISSNEAATSLEETAAALEEITSNIRHNTESIAKMANFSRGGYGGKLYPFFTNFDLFFLLFTINLRG